MDHLRCVVERITYQNPDNGFSVIKCRAKGFQELVAVTGLMPDVHVGSVLILGGSWRIDPKYGRQFSVETFEETLPATVFGIEKYLGSGLIKGVGPKFAGRIVRKFGEETLKVIEEEPDRLLEVEGIGKLRVDRIRASWQEQKEIKNIMLFLQSHNVSTAHATKIFKTYGNESIGIVTDNPYRLADDIWGIGFRTADIIAEKLGFGREKYVRLRSGILYTLNRLADEGHCYATRDMLLETGAQLLAVEDNVIAMTLDEMIRAGDLITEFIPSADGMTGNNASAAGTPSSGAAGACITDPDPSPVPERAIYLPPFFYAEEGSARRLHRIQERGGACAAVRDDSALAAKIRVKTGMEYDDTQLRAIRMALENRVLVLTGGPGTGKTTTTLGIITALQLSGEKILLAAPTGRAAKRLSEATGMEAKTIHRLLEMKPPEGYQRNEEKPLEGDVLIVDECSMIDIILMYNLLKAVPDGMRLILVGDIDQLPSVGAGNVLRDIIDSGVFPVIRLTRIFRQAQKSRIITNAHRINTGKLPVLTNSSDSDFFFTDMERRVRENGQDHEDNGILGREAAKTIVELVKYRLPRYYRVSPGEIQVLTPMQKGAAGASNLNQELQNAVNPAGAGLRRGGYTFRVRDKVMQIRNNYDKEVFNGDIGMIESVNTEDQELVVLFDGRQVKYDISELDELVLAYATTVHKSQGSEYPVVVMPVLMSHYIMLQRNLLYTGITRAKKGLVLVGTKKAIHYAVSNVSVRSRNTMLKERLRTKGMAAGAPGNGRRF